MAVCAPRAAIPVATRATSAAPAAAGTGPAPGEMIPRLRPEHIRGGHFQAIGATPSPVQPGFKGFSERYVKPGHVKVTAARTSTLAQICCQRENAFRKEK
jgi:hypothetical protein